MKNIFIFLIGLSFLFLFVSCGYSEELSSQTKEERTADPWRDPDAIDPSDNPWIQTEFFRKGWQYKTIDLSNGKYIPEVRGVFGEFRDEYVNTFGYQKGTYEYDYFICLTGISYYAAIADNRIFENYMIDDQLVDVFLEQYADPYLFQEPYVDILFETFTLLKKTDFCLHEINVTMTDDYGDSSTDYYADYRHHISEWNTRLALIFSGIDEKLANHTKNLLSLAEKYPEYQGKFLLSDSMRETAEAILLACEPVKERRNTLFSKWEEYYDSRMPECEIQCELLKTKATFKITLTSENNSFVFLDHYQPWVEYSMYSRKPTKSPVVIYMPMEYFYLNGGFLDVRICDRYGNEFDMNEQIDFDFEALEAEKGKIVTIEDPFLDAALTAEFGENYTDIDLCKVKHLVVNYQYERWNWLGDIMEEPTILITFYDMSCGKYEGVSRYCYSDFFEKPYEGDLPKEIKYDLMQFRCLKGLRIFGCNVWKMFTVQERNSFLHEKNYTAENFLFYKGED